MTNLFIKATDLKDVSKSNSEVDRIIKSQLGQAPKLDGVFFASDEKAATLYSLKKRTQSKIDMLKMAKEQVNAELSVLIRKEQSGVDLTEAVMIVPTRTYDAETKETVKVDREVPALERLTSLDNFSVSIDSEINRLQWAIKEINDVMVLPETTGLETYYLKLAVKKNDNVEYPGSDFKALDTTASLMKAVAFEIRNVILERKAAPEFDKIKAGMMSKDAKGLRSVIQANEKTFKKAEWKIAYVLSK